MAEIDPNQRLLHELEPEIERLLERHLANSKEWFSHRLVPYSLGRNYQPGDEWRPEDYPLEDGVRSAIIVNLLTEDNLPYYYETINSWSPDRDHPWSVWARQWTSEEDRHATVIREWVHNVRAVDPEELERMRGVQVSTGRVPQPESVSDMLVYTAVQELATQVAHSNTGRQLDKTGHKVMATVAGDETLHHNFYRDLAASAFEVDASAMVISAYRTIRHFQMPGTGIPDFEHHAKLIADAGIYDFEKYKKSVLAPTLGRWSIDNLVGLSDAAEAAKDGLNRHMARLDKVIAREQRRKSAVA